MKHNTRYSLKHLSVRVPWHDNAWNGTVCNNPKVNGACLVLKNCALNRNDELENKCAGKLLNDLDENQFPVCIDERGTFMSPFAINKTLHHPYVEISPTTHGHLKDTRVTFPSFSAATVPYNWMLSENAKLKADLYDLNFDEAREPSLDWTKDGGNGGWVQELNNQKVLLNCFFEHLQEETSLIFFYAKQVPFVEESGRVLVGVGKIKKIIPSEAYEGSNRRFGAAYWENMVLHSIRPNGKDGFLLPYHEAIKYQVDNPGFDISDLAVIVPNDKRFEFSYGTEHVSNDSAIMVLLECVRSLEKAEVLGIGVNHQEHIQWIHNEIAQLEKLRGVYPGMGSALCAFGIEKGHFVAAEIINQLKDEKENPWNLFEKALEDPKDILSDDVNSQIPFISKKLYLRLKGKSDKTRINLLYLLSRFDLSVEQTKTLYIEEERDKFGIHRTDREYLENPYLIFEDLRLTLMPISLNTIDLGMYLKTAPDNLLPNNLVFDDPFEIHRVRALTIQQLEWAAQTGHTLLPRKEIIKQFQNRQSEYEDYLEWFKTLPLYYETNNFRAVHACWDNNNIEYLRKALVDDRLTDDLIYQSVKKGTELNIAIDETLKGKEMKMPAGLSFTDKDGTVRTEIRIKWWEDPSLMTYKSISVLPIDNLPQQPIRLSELKSSDYYTEHDKSVFFGHYWLKGKPFVYKKNICCLDYSVAKGGNLVAYSMNGESVLEPKNFTFV
jgi:hypothetical protein